MAERNGYPHGVPCWIDVAAPDVDAAVAFYGGLFGWEDEAGPEESSGYRICRLDGKQVAAIGPPFTEGMPAVWTTYFWADSADDVAARVAENGGTVMIGPMDVLDAGRLVVCHDTQGVVFGVWQANEHRGAELVNVPGTWVWSELATRDVEGAKTFYEPVLGLRAEQDDLVPDYLIWRAEGFDPPAGGLSDMGDRFPADEPPCWGVSFAVDDCDAAAAKAEELGASVVQAPFDAGPVGRVAVLTDPNGAEFGIIKLAIPADE